MQNDPRSPTRYAVFEDDPGDCQQTGLTLAEAFHSIMAHCDYEPVWDTCGPKIRLRFKYLDEPFKGAFVGSLQGNLLDCFEAPAFGGLASRNRIMEEVVSAGLRRWYAEPMIEFARSCSTAAGIESREVFEERQPWVLR